MKVDEPSHIVAVIGGACAGSTVAEVLTKSGCPVVVFEQNRRPYGKIEDGLPRWHDKQQRLEYRRIDARLDRPGVTFVPSTTLGQDLDFLDLAQGWGWSALVLANGAWKDRALAVSGAEQAVDNGLLYQNPLIHWFNHEHESDYDGPRYEIPDGAVVVGGGLASIDVIKIVQLQLYERALRERGVDVDVMEMEHAGIPKYCAAHGVDDPASLGVEGGLLIYRRRVEDMPLASAPKGAKDTIKAKIPLIRRKILEKCQKKFLFRFEPQRLPQEIKLEGGKVVALVVQKTVVEGRKVTALADSDHDLPTTLVISSIGSIPEPIDGIEMDGTYYKFKDWETGQYDPIPNVFASGNVITGQGNIKISREHGRKVGEHLARCYLGINDEDGERDISAGPAAAADRGAATANAVARCLNARDPLSADAVNAILKRARARQREVGYEGYAAWIES